MNKNIIFAAALLLVTPLFATITPGHPYYVKTVSNFNDILRNNSYVIVDFYADWCRPCRNLSPIIDEMAREFKDAVFVKVDIELLNSIASQYSVRSLPTLIFFKNGKIVDRVTGFKKKRDLRNKIQKNR